MGYRATGLFWECTELHKACVRAEFRCFQVLPRLGRHWKSYLFNHNLGLCCPCCTWVLLWTHKPRGWCSKFLQKAWVDVSLIQLMMILFFSQTPMKAWKVQLFMHNKAWSLSRFVSADVVKTRQYLKLHKRCAFLMQSITFLASRMLCQSWVSRNIPDILMQVHTAPVWDVCLSAKEKFKSWSGSPSPFLQMRYKFKNCH